MNRERNLPDSIILNSGAMTTFLYSADGTKLQMKVTTAAGSSTVTKYMGNLVYENGVASRVLTGEGYLNRSNGTYHFFLTDHQGNVRVVTDAAGSQAEEVNHYYPFGALFVTSSNVQPYKYNGKEAYSQQNLDLYDYGARLYDPLTARFTTSDPLCEKYYPLSPYAYCANNPVNYVDPDGRDTLFFNNDGVYTHRVKAIGNHVGIATHENKRISFDFVYQGDADRFLNDEEFDVALNREEYMLKTSNERLERVVFMEKKEINKILKSTVSLSFFPSPFVSPRALWYAAKESKGGKLDFVNEQYIQDRPNFLFITSNNGRYLAHDAWNFGNYLWGAAMRKIGIPYLTAVCGAHFQNFFMDSDNRWHFDSIDDQRSIFEGYFSY